MTQLFSGHLFPPHSSERSAVDVEVSEAGAITLSDTVGAPVLVASWSDVKLSHRIGNAPRRITFRDGEVLETTDNDAVDRIDRALRGTTTASLFHKMERLTLFTLLVLVVMAALSFSFFKWWLPAASDSMAMTLPPGLLDSIGSQTLKIMDKGPLAPSDLDADVQEKYREQFERILSATGPMEQSPELLFRSGAFIGPNAFALPNGNIVLTDEIIKLATHDSQILGVLAHEISHVENRHVMRSFLRSTSIAVIIVLITGDMAELTEMAIAIPTFMLKMGYSRDFEREADQRAVTLMKTLGEDPRHLADLFELLGGDCKEDCGNTWISSHPDTNERIEAIKSQAH